MNSPDDKMAKLIAALEAMLQDDEEISARGVVRRLPDTFKHASDITSARRTAPSVGDPPETPDRAALTDGEGEQAVQGQSLSGY